jgi:hypothetical protein
MKFEATAFCEDEDNEKLIVRAIGALYGIVSYLCLKWLESRISA